MGRVLSTERRAGGLGGDLLLLTAAAISATSSWSTTSAPYNLAAIMLGAIAVSVGIARFGLGTPRPVSVIAALVITLIPQVKRPPSPNVHQTAFYPWSVAIGVAAVLFLMLALLAAFSGRSDSALSAALTQASWPLLGAGFAAMTVAVLITVPGGTHPEIDVWSIFQQSAAGLFHGINPYRITDFSVPAGQTANCFNYLPVSFLASWVGWVSADDVRYSEDVIMLCGWLALAAAIVVRTERGSRIRFTALTLLLTGITLAGTLRVAQQAWNESLILGFLLIGAAILLLANYPTVLPSRRHANARLGLSGMAGLASSSSLPIGLALATKQHVALILPLLAFWPTIGWRRTGYAVLTAFVVSAPWVFWDFGRFKKCTVDFFLDIEERKDSISLWRFLPHPTQNLAVLLGLAIAYWLAFKFVPRTVGGLLVSAGLVLFGFDLSNKQTFENQWWLVAQLLVCGLAVGVVESELVQRRKPEYEPLAAE
ncbi:MAG: hypothetical protein JWN95_1056 [Frankiales bacterium]|nr:hypothetical protein [Frankiales bacterium]